MMQSHSLPDIPNTPNAPRHRHLDLALVIDCIGDQQTVRRRCAFANDLMSELLARMGPEALLCIGVVGYNDRDPMDRPHMRRHNPISVHTLSGYSEAAQALAVLGAADAQELDFEAAICDVLETLSHAGWAWHAGSARLAVVIGSRPPHPPPGSQMAQQVPDPLGRDWRELLGALTSGARLHVMSLLCPIYWPGGAATLPAHAWPYVAQCWALLGADGLFEAETTSPHTIVDAIMRRVLA